jgi:t-SNARE complex subunit (syntaxin)
MEYINEFHKEWIERTRQSIASWSKQPISLEEKKKQQERLNQQRAIREGKQKTDRPCQCQQFMNFSFRAECLNTIIDFPDKQDCIEIYYLSL